MGLATPLSSHPRGCWEDGQNTMGQKLEARKGREDMEQAIQKELDSLNGSQAYITEKDGALGGLEGIKLNCTDKGQGGTVGKWLPAWKIKGECFFFSPDRVATGLATSRRPEEQ